MQNPGLKFTVRRRVVLREAMIGFGAWLMLVAPAIWNRFPLLEYDTGGYLARWYEGYLVPSRPAPYGLLLNLGSFLDFWPVVALQAALTVWVLSLVMRLHRLQQRPLARLVIFVALAVATTLPWIASILLTDIFTGLAVLALYILTFKSNSISRRERGGLVLLVAFGAATHSATLLLVIGLGIVIMAAALIWPRIVPRAASGRIALTLVLGVAILLACNFVVARKIAWTPGGYGIVFGRLLQDGIVTRYLERHCPDPRFRLCDYRHELPRNADVFLWGNEIFTKLGRFDGLGEEMRTIVLESLAEYPWQQLTTAVSAAARQLVSVGSGEGVLDTIWHSYGMIELYTPWNLPAMRAARQQHGEVSFTTLNRLHVPVGLLAMALLPVFLVIAARRREAGDSARIAGFVTLALLINACILGPLSNPHDRYGARVVWLASFVVALWLASARRDESGKPSDTP